MTFVRILGGLIVIAAGFLLWWTEPWSEQSREWPGVASVVAFTEADLLFSGAVWDRNNGFTRVNLGTVRNGEPARRSGAGMRWGISPSGHGQSTHLWLNDRFLAPSLDAYPLRRNLRRRPLWASADRRKREAGIDSLLLTGYAADTVPEFSDPSHESAFSRVIQKWRQPEDGVPARGEFAIAGSDCLGEAAMFGATRRDDGSLLVRIEGGSKSLDLEYQVHYPGYSMGHKMVEPGPVVHMAHPVPEDGAIVLRLLHGDRVVAGLAFLGQAIAVDTRRPSRVMHALMQVTRRLGGP